jgi:hypothetical protein
VPLLAAAAIRLSYGRGDFGKPFSLTMITDIRTTQSLSNSSQEKTFTSKNPGAFFTPAPLAAIVAGSAVYLASWALD